MFFEKLNSQKLKKTTSEYVRYNGANFETMTSKAY